MLKIPLALVSAAFLIGAAHAQTAATTAQPDAAKPEADVAKGAGGASGTSGFANQETYKMKDGGMYQPPAQRPASPAQDLSIYGRT